MTLTEAGKAIVDGYYAFVDVAYGEYGVIWPGLLNLLNEVYTWVFNHPVEFDLGLLLFVVGSFTLLLRRDKIARSRAYRLAWGALMKRKDREKYHRMVFEDAILDAEMRMVAAGDMTPEEGKKHLMKMCRSYDLTGLMPGHDQASVKRGVNWRLMQGWWTKKKAMWIGPPPGGPVDPNYKPVFEVARPGLKSSKYLTEK